MPLRPLLAALLLFASASLSAQVLVRADSAPGKQLAPFFTPKPDERKLACEVRILQPRFSFSFEYWTGYDIVVEGRAFAKEGRNAPMVVAVKVTPENGEQVFFYSRVGFTRRVPPKAWETKGVQLSFGGGYVIGPGRYQVNLLAVDGAARACRKSWKVDAPNRNLPTKVPPATAREAGYEEWKGLPAVADSSTPPRKATLFLHAAPLFRRRNVTRLGAWDQAVLLESARTILEQGGFNSARLVVFDLDGRRVLFESDKFDKEDYLRLVETLRNVNFGTVSMQTLQGPNDAGFLERMVRKEVEKDSASTQAIFLGPSWRMGGKITPLLRELRTQLPPSFYVSFCAFTLPPDDILTSFVKSGKGKVLAIYQPQDLAKAIRSIRERSTE